MAKNFPAGEEANIPAGLLRLKQGRSIKACLLFVVLFPVLFLSLPAAAAVDSFVAESSDGTCHQYCYEDLLESYALKLLGASNGLYEDYAAKKPVAVRCTTGRYIDYNDILDQYARTVLQGGRFSVHHYILSEEAAPANMPGLIKLVSVSPGGLSRAEFALGEHASLVAADDPAPGGENGADRQLDAEPPGDEGKNPDSIKTNTPIIGESQVTLDRALQWAESKRAHRRFIDVAQLYWDYGKKTGMRPEVLYAQSAYETGFGHYRGIVPPDYNNWAGIKTAGAGGDRPEDHEQFDTPEDGVRAHFNHMAAYVGLEPIGEPHGRYHVVERLSWAGTIETVEELSGRWSPLPTYHERIVEMLKEMKN